MIQLTVLYRHPQDPAAFDRHWRDVHVPLSQKIPGLQGLMSIKPASLEPQEPSPYYRIALVYFEDMTAFQSALQSPEMQAAGADVSNFATGGLTLVVGEVEVYHSIAIS